jgi:hypothetical protein
MGSDITEYVNADSGWKISFVDYINIDQNSGYQHQHRFNAITA